MKPRKMEEPFRAVCSLLLGSCFISRPAKSENLVPQSFFAPKANGNACYAGYSIFNWVS